jgi:hypothetical protein
MGTSAPTRVATTVILLLSYSLTTVADAAVSVPLSDELNLTSQVVTAFHLHDVGYDVEHVDICKRELDRIKQEKVSSIGNTPVSMASIAGLYWLNGWLKHVPDTSVLRPSDVAKPVELRPQLQNINRFFSEGVRIFDPHEYDQLFKGMREIRSALEAEAEATGTAESRNLLEAFQDLQTLVSNSQYKAILNELALRDTQTYPGAKELFKAVDKVHEQMSKLLSIEREYTTAAAATVEANTAAGVVAAESAAETGVINLAVAEDGMAAEAELATGERSALGGIASKAGPIAMLVLFTAQIGVQIYKATPSGKRAVAQAQANIEGKNKALAAQTVAFWSKYPEASDAYVFGTSTAEVCAHANRDQKGFGKVVSEKMGAIEMLYETQKAMSQTRSQYAMATPLSEVPDKRFPADGVALDAELITPPAPGSAGQGNGAQAL